MVSLSTCRRRPCRPYSLISIRAYACVLIIQSTVDIGAVVEHAISPLDWPSPALVHEVPVEACERSVLVTLVLQKSLALLHAEFLEVPINEGGVVLLVQ